MPRRTLVIGPAYLDRVLRVVDPLTIEGEGGPIDQSAEAAGEFGGGESIVIEDPAGYALEIDPPEGWPGPTGRMTLRDPIRAGLSGRRHIRAVSWADDLGGMGAGFASALGGTLVSALGENADPIRRKIVARISKVGITHHPIRTPHHPADWTLLVTSGEHGDKLAIGFRGSHAAIDPEELTELASKPTDLLVVSALPNRLIGPVLRRSSAKTRFLAPSLRNMTDRHDPLTGFADRVSFLSCNRTEWQELDDRERVGSLIPIVAITDGPRGAEVRFTDPSGERRGCVRPAFPRSRPPRDTNRAGEAFASAMLLALLDRGWDGGFRNVPQDWIREAIDRGSAAAALVLDRLDFGFPTTREIDSALRDGRVIGWSPDHAIADAAAGGSCYTQE